jgi:hypothetical protein
MVKRAHYFFRRYIVMYENHDSLYERPNKVLVYQNGSYRVVLRLRNNHPGFVPWALNGQTEVAKFCEKIKFYGHYNDKPGDFYEVPKDVLDALEKAWEDCESGKYDEEYNRCTQVQVAV